LGSQKYRHLRLYGSARKLAEIAIQNIRQNLFFTDNSLGAPITLDILYPLTGTSLSPMIMEIQAVTVIADEVLIC